MQYDSVKDRLHKLLGESPFARRMFFAALDRLFLRSRYVARELTRLKNSSFQPTAILDAGSGFGQYCVRLARIFPQASIIGLDLKSEIVASGNRFASRTGTKNLTFEVGDLLNLPYESQFDLVISVDVLEHIEEDRLVLANISRALKPGGRFMFTTPYFDGVNPSAAVFVDEHVRPGYSRPEATEKLAEAGLELQQFTITYGHWGNIAWHLLQKWPITILAGRQWMLPIVLFYYIFAYPAAWFCMRMDMKTIHQAGGGILAIATKKFTEDAHHAIL